MSKVVTIPEGCVTVAQNVVGGIPTTIAIGPVRFSYASVFEPGPTPSGTLKYQTAALMPKQIADFQPCIDQAVQVAIAKGIEGKKFTQLDVENPKFKYPVRDGDEAVRLGERSGEYGGMWFMNTSADPARHKPKVLDINKTEIFDKSLFYSGCWGIIVVNFYPYNTAGNKGIGAGLQHVMKLADDDRLGGGVSADDAFAGVDMGHGQASEKDDNPLI